MIRYAIAVFLVLLAWAVTFTLRTSVQAPTFQTPFFVCAIVLSGWMGGFGPGILATVLSIFALEYWLTLEACMPDNVKAGGYCLALVRCDVTKPEDRRAVRDHFERRYGKVDILINKRRS